VFAPGSIDAAGTSEEGIVRERTVRMNWVWVGAFVLCGVMAAGEAATPAATADLKFNEMFTMPVGPLGLTPSTRLRALDGKRVRIVGYMVQQEPATPGMFLLSPLPVVAGDEDESLADDIPANAVLVRLPTATKNKLRGQAGLVRVTGVLHVGLSTDTASGRSAAASLEADAATTRALLQVAHTGARPVKPHP